MNLHSESRWLVASIQQLIGHITNDDAKIRDAARSELVKLGSSAVELLIAALDSTSDWQRKGVITLLQQIDDQRVIPPLLKALNDPDSIVRGLAAVALAVRQEQSALPVIQKMVEAESDPFARSQMLDAVYKLGQRQWVIDYASRILTESTFNNRDRQATIQFILRLNDPATADLLLEVFKQGESSVANNALQGLKQFKDERVVDILIAQLKDEAPHKRGTAIVELGNFGTVRAIEAIKTLVNDNAIAWQGDRPGEPATTVGQAARDALKKLGTVPVDPKGPAAPKKEGLLAQALRGFRKSGD